METAGNTVSEIDPAATSSVLDARVGELLGGEGSVDFGLVVDEQGRVDAAGW